MPIYTLIRLCRVYLIGYGILFGLMKAESGRMLNGGGNFKYYELLDAAIINYFTFSISEIKTLLEYNEIGYKKLTVLIAKIYFFIVDVATLVTNPKSLEYGKFLAGYRSLDGIISYRRSNKFSAEIDYDLTVLIKLIEGSIFEKWAKERNKTSFPLLFGIRSISKIGASPTVILYWMESASKIYL